MTNLRTLTITRGLPAAGKTTWAKQWVAQDPARRARVNRDDLRSMLFEVPTYKWDQEERVTAAQRDAVRALLKAGSDVVCDDTNLRPKYVREWARFAAGNGADLKIVEFPIDVDEAIARDASRTCTVGESVIRDMAERFTRAGQLLIIPDAVLDVPDPERYEPKPGSAPAIIVDIDGTLAIKSAGRDIYDLSRVHEDTPNRGVIAAVQAAARNGISIIYCSGRDASSRAATATWIDANVGIPGPLHMRAAGDRRRDSIVKRELFDARIRDVYDVLYVLDDRNQVVEMWRALGLTVFQVAEGDF